MIASAISYVVLNFREKVELTTASGTVFSLLVAETEVERELGLSEKPKLGPNEGLLMAFPSDGLHSIWMKDMNFPLDIIWLSESKEVIYIAENAQPEGASPETVYTPKKSARYVIELPAGSIRQHAIRGGQTLDFTYTGNPE